MERRYLVAALAIIATFTVTSRGFRTLEHISLLNAAHAGAVAKSRCQSSSPAQAIAKIRTRLRPRFPEEAQLLAEMNGPLSNMQTTIAEQMARQDAAVAQCARARAMRDAERAYRDAMRLQEQMRHSAGYFSVPPAPISTLPPDIEARIQQKTAAIAARVAAANVRLQLANDKLGDSSMQMDDVDIPTVVVSDDGGKVSTHVHVRTHVRCNVSRTMPDQRQPQ
jgi:hypothetical protein